MLPFDRSYWVIPGKLLAGEIPSAVEEATRKQKVENLVMMGFDAIINLMEDGERTFSGDLLIDYTDDLEYYAAQISKIITVHHLPIPDLSVTSIEKMRETLHLIYKLIEEGKKVYVHCWGGVGRTGTVVGCYLMEHNMATTVNVIQTIDYLKRTTPISNRNSPETEEQVNFVLNWPLSRSLNS
jgi:protein tyrosine/serine phosphatase